MMRARRSKIRWGMGVAVAVVMGSAWFFGVQSPTLQPAFAGPSWQVEWEKVLEKARKEGSYASASYGGIALVSKAPHSNAAKVYINWVLGKEAQALLVDAARWVSRRKDVPPKDPAAVLKPGGKYFKVYTEDNTFLYKTKKYRALMKEVFGVVGKKRENK